MVNESLEQRIADAIIAYARDRANHLPGYGDDPDAGYVYDQLMTDARHIAHTATADLELTEEWGTLRDGSDYEPHTTPGLRGLAMTEFEARKWAKAWKHNVVHRFVTSWTNVEE